MPEESRWMGLYARGEQREEYISHRIAEGCYVGLAVNAESRAKQQGASEHVVLCARARGAHSPRWSHRSRISRRTTCCQARDRASVQPS